MKDKSNHVFNQLINGQIDVTWERRRVIDFVIDKRELNILCELSESGYFSNAHPKYQQRHLKWLIFHANENRNFNFLFLFSFFGFYWNIHDQSIMEKS